MGLSLVLIGGGSIILGGDLNFSLGDVEVWGPRARGDPHMDCFIHKLSDFEMMDVEPVKIKPTWRNKRVGEDCIAKCLYCFLVVGNFLELLLQLIQWVRSGGNLIISQFSLR